jgi:hypothetical protein
MEAALDKYSREGAPRKVVAVLVAHLFGRRYDMEPVIQLTERYRVDVRTHPMRAWWWAPSHALHSLTMIVCACQHGVCVLMCARGDLRGMCASTRTVHRRSR